jgi:hypothetical protein
VCLFIQKKCPRRPPPVPVFQGTRVSEQDNYWVNKVLLLLFEMIFIIIVAFHSKLFYYLFLILQFLSKNKTCLLPSNKL